ncbi:MAG: hypothetical protein VB115_02190 [Christensenellaceae bacterium]|nr:hypothetical protein [Christensenellaceae bacterium]
MDYFQSAHELFHELFGGLLLQRGFRKHPHDYIFTDIDAGYSIGVSYECMGIAKPVIHLEVGLSTLTEEFSRYNIEGYCDEQGCRRLFSGDYPFLYAFTNSGDIYRARPTPQEMFDIYYPIFVERILPILDEVRDEKSCYEAMVKFDGIFGVRASKMSVFTALTNGYKKQALQIIRRIANGRDRDYKNWERDEHRRLLELVTGDNTEQLEKIIEARREKGRENYARYLAIADAEDRQGS